MGARVDLDMEPFSEEEIMAELVEMSTEAAPRRFTVCVVHPDLTDAGVMGWGMAFADQLVVYLMPGDLLEDRQSLRCMSREGRLWRELSRREGVRIIWIDSEN
jgi:hypothetical protein